MDLELISLIKQYGFISVIILYALLRLVEWAIRHAYNAAMSKVKIVEQGICEVDKPIIVSNKQLKDAICELDKKTNEAHDFCKETNRVIDDFCKKSHESRTETKMLVESIRSMIEEISHDVQRISDESGNVYKLIAERLLNGYRDRKNGSQRNNGSA